ncbi:50S ribosomal protein L3 [Desulfosarcina ovata]|uniref:Large ribosomal subunit protein uL3 n=2 Tax=Desulfosarcina ovata TaxID=83564 RepID=A0A5K8AIS5_9BACT|nr:50S ribosomal protein L3 [Desulfosarcina ovata]BBO85542.1 50S ribosomal protein L3 [Desulfosarcina ovata subsp. sediminis]BBO92577.1 50S ribosomal protein L3 [Desulfosarcina ovata subsp. ovata]
MCKGLVGKKLGMTSLFASNGKYIPVTVLQVGPCVITQIKKLATDGYQALQIGFGDKKPSKTTKPLQGHFKKSGDGCYRTVKEVGVENPDEYTLGQMIGTELFSIGEKVNVTGTTKGRGFSGVMKRHGFGGGRQTHGCKNHRVPGSIGCSAWPAKVIKGKRMPGQYGVETKTVRNLEIVDIRPEENLILLNGPVPGSKSAIVTINKVLFA